MSLSASERETVIQFDEEFKTANIYTCSRPVMTKLDKLCNSYPDNYKIIKQDTYSKTYECSDKKLITFRSQKVKRILTDEQKKEIAQRFKQSKSILR